MIGPLVLAMLAKSAAPYAPPPELWYHQATACAGSAMAEKASAGAEPTSEQFGELMVWGLILAETGPKANRSRAQVDSEDVKTAEAFYRRVKTTKPPAFAAHRAYCRALLDADRP